MSGRLHAHSSVNRCQIIFVKLHQLQDPLMWYITSFARTHLVTQNPAYEMNYLDEQLIETVMNYVLHISYKKDHHTKRESALNLEFYITLKSYNYIDGILQLYCLRQIDKDYRSNPRQPHNQSVVGASCCFLILTGCCCKLQCTCLLLN